MKRITPLRAASVLLQIALLLAILVVTAFPFVMMLTGSFKQDYEIFTLTPRLLPRNGLDLSMYRLLFANWPFFRNLANSLIVSIATTVLTCLFCTLAGYAFAKFDFPGKQLLFLMLLSALMIPLETRLVPTYLIVKGMNGLNRFWSLIVPNAIPAFGVFMMRQFATTGIPAETLESARVEGAGENQILVRIVFPMLLPGIFSLAILTFMNNWNDFLWPIIIATRKEMLTVTALIRSLGDSSLSKGFGVLMAATTLSALPILGLYFAFHKQLVKAILEGTGRE